MGQVLDALPSQVLELRRKKFHTFNFGPNHNVWFVTDGLMMSVRSAEDGRFKGTSLFGVNSILGLSGFYGLDKDVTCFTLSQTVLRGISTRLLSNLLKENARLCYEMMLYSSRLFSRVMDELETSTLRTLEEQIASFENNLRQMDLPADFSVTETCVAMAIGAHPVSVSRARKRLKDSGNKPSQR
jgi:CRP-like cAMP-binding protein